MTLFFSTLFAINVVALHIGYIEIRGKTDSSSIHSFFFSFEYENTLSVSWMNYKSIMALQEQTSQYV